MVELLVLADDLTGALDTGVQFAQQNIPTLVSTRIQQLNQGTTESFSVFVLDMETRHTPPLKAKTIVKETVKLALHQGVRSFYKKTDSTLRGNIGIELEALLEATGVSLLSFVPAYPKNDRITFTGRQYVKGVPVHLSIYSRDPQNPVCSSYVPDIIAAQTTIPVHIAGYSQHGQFEGPKVGGRRIVVFDSRTDEDLRYIANLLKRRGLHRVTAGCAGFAEFLPLALDLKRQAAVKIKCPHQILIVCGSTNRVSLDQIEKAVRQGVDRIVLHPDQLLGRSGNERDAIFESSLLPRIEEILIGGRDLILQTTQGEEDLWCSQGYACQHSLQTLSAPRLVAQMLGVLVGTILCFRPTLTLIVFGGDTALGIVERLGFSEILPIKQISPGVVLSSMIKDSLRVPVITKAGGFGSSKVIQEIKRFVSRN